MDIAAFIHEHLDEEKSAVLAGLNYTRDFSSGYTRKPAGEKKFDYFGLNGQKLTSEETIDYLNSLAIPPAWTNVWINPDRDGHLLVTGFDDKERKQYIYHPKWRKTRDLLNGYRMIFFGETLSQIRAKADKDFQEEPLSKPQVLATLVKILDETYIRIGDEIYANENQSYGLTTLRDKHVHHEDGELVLEFVGKSGKEHGIVIEDEDLAAAIEACKDITGRRLFQYMENDERKPITALDLNEYLGTFGTYDFTAKDFRTWGGTLKVYECLTRKTYDLLSRKKPLSQAFELAAASLGNTAAVVRKSYVHQHLIEIIEDDTLEAYTGKIAIDRSRNHLSRAETELIELLKLLFQDKLKSLKS